MLDPRVIKAALMAGATAGSGWNNGQHLVDGVITTDQALDYSVGAGMLDLDQAYRIYVGDPSGFSFGGMFFIDFGLGTTTGVTGSSGGAVHSLRGWDLGSVMGDAAAGAGGVNDYAIDQPLDAGSTLTAALTWFADRTLGSTLDSAADVSLANLSLELLRTDLPGGPSLVAQSISPYGTSEFLRLTVPQAGLYEIRVRGLAPTYNLSSSAAAATEYGLAWAIAVPEPSTWVLLAGAAVAVTSGLRPPSRRDRRSAAARHGPPCRQSGFPCG
ncbi:MAG: hypothetical protein EBZ59_01795 [Planctomycetia bacterium]|nr:hypothetical protein [Planctomycetia bacterium]